MQGAAEIAKRCCIPQPGWPYPITICVSDSNAQDIPDRTPGAAAAGGIGATDGSEFDRRIARPRRKTSSLAGMWSGRWESNPRL